MPLIERERVVEWRITRPLGNYNVRYWIESDPAFGGMTYHDALKLVGEAHELALNNREIRILLQRPSGEQEPLALFLFGNVPPASSVEVCDAFGCGVALHRDWP